MRNLLSFALVCFACAVPIAAGQIYRWHTGAAASVEAASGTKGAASTGQADGTDAEEQEDTLTMEEEIGEHTKAAALLDTVNLYADAAEDAEAIAVIPYGERMDVLSEEGSWYCVTYGDSKGYVRTSDVVRFNETKQQVALTFDDGPSAKNTPIVLDALEKYGCRATFFLVGQNVNDSTGDILKREVALGCQIGNHTYSHKNLKTLKKKKKIKKQFKKADKAIQTYVDSGAALVRTPYGATSKKVLSAAGRPNIYWSVDTEDWKYKDTKRLIRYVAKQAKDGDIILMHDIHESTAEAVDSICKKLLKKGFEMVTVSELAAIRGEKLEAGHTYTGFGENEE